MKKLIVLCYFIYISCYSAHQFKPFVDITSQNVHLLFTKEVRFCYISFVEIDGQQYLIKQKKDAFQYKLLGVVRDAVTATIAQSFVPAHCVDIIPVDFPFPGKMRTDWPATIHTIAPGNPIKHQKDVFAAMNIKQADQGIRYEMFEWMHKYPSLIKIIALDTFLCNYDRNRGNLFYDSTNDEFCVIDMDSSFKFNLPAISHAFFEMLSQNPIALTQREKKVVKAYKKALVILIKKYNAEDIIALYDYFLVKAGLTPESLCYDMRMALQIESDKAIIRQSYEDVKKLVRIIDEIV